MTISSIEIEKIKIEVSIDIERIINYLFPDNALICKKVIRYHFGWHQPGSKQGKMLRPLLVTMTCKALGGRWREAIGAASAVELIHNFSLIHDDIEDQDEIRHGRKTAWKKFGIAQAINAGDALIGAAFYRLYQEDRRKTGEIDRIGGKYLANTLVDLTKGQSLDIAFQKKLKTDIADYWTVVDLKTGGLIAESCRLGALSAGADTKTIDQMYEYGLLIGRAFQIRDDIKGIWGLPERTGKSNISDLIQHKRTLPVILACNSDANFQQIWQKDSLTKNDLKQLMEIMNGMGVLKQVTWMMEEHLSTAKVKLEELKESFKELMTVNDVISLIFSNEN